MLRIPFLSSLICQRSNQNIDRIRGCNFSLFKEDIININGFNEDFKTWGGEDSEFVQRLFNNGIQRKNLKFSAIQYHIFHKEGKPNNDNTAILDNVINNNINWCENGIDKHS
jgi:hypothetical protein